MPETSRDCVVILLDESSFTVPVKATLLGRELLDMAASHCKVKEKEYFGLFTDGDGYKNWLELDKPVLDPSQDLPKSSQPIRICFAFKYFVDDLRYLQDFMTVELLYLQSRQAIMKGEIQTDDATIFELAACAMQAQHGDYKTEVEAQQHLKHLPVLPAHLFNTKSVQYCEGEVVRYYRMMQNLSRGEAIIKYLEIIQSLPMFAMHYFEVKDKKDVPLWLGVGPDGICQCSRSNRNEPDSRYQWLQLQNIYYRDRKFSMEVYQSTKPSRKGVGFGPVVVLAWYGNNSKVVMAIWKMARDQHMFYRSKRTNKNPHMGMNTTEIIRQLSKLHRANISPSSSHSSLSIESAKSNQTQASAEAVAAAKAAQNEMYSALLTKRATLIRLFEQKAARYKEILIKEMQITGIPPEGLTAEEIERMRKRFGVSFKFSKFVLNDSAIGGDGEVEELEKQLEIQSSIIEASRTLLNQASTRKLKKDRKKEIRQLEDKYVKMEEKLQELKRSKRGSTSSASSAKFHIDSPTSLYGNSLQVPSSVSAARKKCATLAGSSVDDTYLASMIFNTPSTKQSPAGGSLQKSPHHKSTSALSDLQSGQPQDQAKHTPVSATQSFAYHPHHKQSYSSMHSEQSFASDYAQSPSYLSSAAFNEDFDMSPPSSVVSANTSFIHQGQRRDHHGLRDFDLAEDFLQHLTRERREGFSPPPTNPSPQTHLSPRRPNTDSGYGSSRHLPVTSSPLSQKRSSSPSPDVHYPVDPRSGYMMNHGGVGVANRFRSSSPELYLPAPDFQQTYSSSHQPPSTFSRTLPNPNQRPSPQSYTSASAPNKPAYKLNTAPPNPNWYNNGGTDQSYQDAGLRGGEQHQSVTGGHPAPTGQKIPAPGRRKPSEESYDLQEMLKIWDESNKNPFGEGTLV